MSAYNTALNTMMDAILTGDAKPALGLLHDKQDFPASAQLGVYIEGYRLRLRDAVQSAYPALLHYLGKAQFLALADSFVTTHPSRHFNLDAYAIVFGGYVARASDDSFACELALLESAIHDVYQREETPAMGADWAQRQTPESLAVIPLLPRAASRLLAFKTPVNDYLTALRAGDNLPSLVPRENWLIVVRHQHQVRRLALAQGEYELLCLLNAGLTLSQALEDPRLAAYAGEEDFSTFLQAWFSRWVSEGILRSPT